MLSVANASGDTSASNPELTLNLGNTNSEIDINFVNNGVSSAMAQILLNFGSAGNSAPSAGIQINLQG
jgi:hypothetical protein